jgi:DNA polymerase III subunit epsilon
MTGWHPGPLVGFDLETTGPDPETARIVTAAIVIWNGAGVTAQSTFLVNPGVEIPAEATAVHGITTEVAREKGIDAARAAYEVSAKLASVILDGAPLVAYNAPYDLTVLDRETRRHGTEPFGDVFSGCSGCVIDPLVLDKHLDPYRKGKRTLTAACEHYGVRLDGAHDAASDAIAAMRLAWKIGAANPSLAALSPVALHDLQVKAKASQAASFQEYLRRQGSTEVIDGSWPMRAWAGVAA